MEAKKFFVVVPPRLHDYSVNNDIARRLVDKHRALRLHALKTVPDAFGSTYDAELSRTPAQWLEKLGDARVEHIWAIDKDIEPYAASRHDEYFEALFQSQWVGFAGIRGPIDPEPTITSSQSSSVQDASLTAMNHGNETVHYHLVGTFVDNIARRSGVGQALVEAAHSKAQEAAELQKKKLHLTVLVNEGNDSARRLYERTGFVVTGEESYVQQPRTFLGETEPAERVALHMTMREGLENHT